MAKRADQRAAVDVARWSLLWLAVLGLGLLHPVMVFVAVGGAVVTGVALGVRHLRRERRLNKEGPPPFWGDQI